MRLVTWNIQWGLGMDGRVDCARIADWLRAQDADVICLQEVSAGMAELAGADGSDQFAQFAKLFPEYRLVDGAGVETWDAQQRSRRFGNAILSRFPIAQVRRHALPWLDDGKMTMPRLLLEAIVVTPGGPLRIMTTHLEYFSQAAREKHVDVIVAIVAEAQARARTTPTIGAGPYAATPQIASTILTGDFNMRPHEPARLRIEQPGPDYAPLRDAWTLLNGQSPHLPSFCIADQTYGEPHCADYVFLSSDLAARLSNVVYDQDVRYSDHQPVVVEFFASDSDPKTN